MSQRGSVRGVICHSRCISIRGSPATVPRRWWQPPPGDPRGELGTQPRSTSSMQAPARTRSAPRPGGQVEAVSHEAHRVLEHPGVLLPSIQGTSRPSTDRPEADLVPRVHPEWWQGTSTDSLHRTQVISVTSAECDREDLEPGPVHAGAVEGGPARSPAAWMVALGLPEGGVVGPRWWPVTQSAVVTTSMPASSTRSVQVDVGEHAVEGHAVGLLAAGSPSTVPVPITPTGSMPDLAGVPPDLVGR